jgi:hypothetical protein
MSISFKPRHLKLYADLGRIFARYGRSDLAVGMGPTFVKAGQLHSTRPDLLPVEYLVALSRLHDKVEPFDSEEAGFFHADPHPGTTRHRGITVINRERSV